MRILLFLLLLLQFSPLWGQLYFNRTYAKHGCLDDVDYNIQKRTDNLGYILPTMTIDSFLQINYGWRFIDNDGLETGFKQYYPLSTGMFGGFEDWNLIPTRDSGYVHACLLDSTCIMKFDKNFNLQWRTIFADPSGVPSGVIELSSGNFVCTWCKLEPDSGLHLYLFNANGTELNHVRVDTLGMGESNITQLAELNSGDVFFGGNFWRDTSNCFFMSRITSDLHDLMWFRNYGLQNPTSNLLGALFKVRVQDSLMSIMFGN
jgi:hypothetical protein